MNVKILCRGEKNSPCIYLMGGHEISLAPMENIWVIQIKGEDWNRDFSPWPAPRIFRQQDDFSGGADAWLQALAEKAGVLEAEIGLMPAWRGIAGYSLAGLFSLYALLKCGLFSRCACMSASLWYPGFTEFFRASSFSQVPEYVYFSLGDQEHKARDPLLSCIDKKTEEIMQILKEKGISCSFSSCPGGHFQNVEKRIRLGLEALLLFQKKIDN